MVKKRINQDTVSVIVLNYNGKKLTEECVLSVLKSDYPSYEIVIVDNGSSDDSVSYLKTKFKGNKKIRLLATGKNYFFTGGFNYGAVHSKGKWIILLSNDIVVDPSWITHLVEATGGDSTIFVQPKIMRYDKRNIIDNVGGRYNIWGFGEGMGRGEVDRGQYDKPLLLDYASATTFMADRSFFLSLGGYDQWFYSHYEDCDVSFRAKKKGGISLLAYKSIIYHRGSVTYKKHVDNPTLLYHIRKNRVAVVLRNFSGFKLLVRFTLVTLEHIFFAVQDLLTFKKERRYITLKAFASALKKGTKVQKINLAKVYR